MSNRLFHQLDKVLALFMEVEQQKPVEARESHAEDRGGPLDRCLGRV
jgi:hypothetical protein